MTPRWIPLVVPNALGLFTAWQVWVMDDELGIGQCLLWRLVPWELWVLAIPLIVLIRRRFSATRRGVLTSIPLHLVLFAAITVSFELTGFLCGRLADIEAYRGLQVMEKVPWLILRGTTFSAAIYVAVLVRDWAFEYRARYQETSKHLAMAQLVALKTQLHPHFLFNTLNSISVLVRKADNELALKMVNGLAELLRYSLRAMKVDLVPVTEELDFIRRYLEIQGVRFSDRLTISIELAPEAVTARLPSLILQPIVENAIKHGVSRRAGKSRLEIVVRPVAPGRLRVEVRDDGPEPDAAPISAEDGAGVGLAHVRSRLAQLYPDRHAFALEPRPGGGAMAVLEVPFERAAASG